MLLVGFAAVPAQAESARSQQWYLDAMHADGMWKTSTGKGVTVAVVDTGVDTSLPDLKGRVLKGKDFSKLPGGVTHDYANHGTGMATMIAGSGEAGAAKGTYGLASDTKILPVKLNDHSAGAKSEYDAEKRMSTSMASSVQYAADSDAKIINISMADENKYPNVARAVKYALSKGKLVFAGVGNSAQKGNPTMYPAALPGVVGVGAIGKDVEVTNESEQGPQVDLVAPGEEMVHSCSGGSELCKSHGTSDSTAIASASAALIWSKHPNWTANQVIRVLVNTAGKPKSGEKRNDFVGFGVVRPRIALKNPGDPGDPKTNPLPGPYNEQTVAKAEKKRQEAAQQDGKSGPTASDNGGIPTLGWAGIGVGALVVLAAAVGTPILISRRRRELASTPPVGHANPYQQSTPPQWPTTPPPPRQHPDQERRY